MIKDPPKSQLLKKNDRLLTHSQNQPPFAIDIDVFALVKAIRWLDQLDAQWNQTSDFPVPIKSLKLADFHIIYISSLWADTFSYFVGNCYCHPLQFRLRLGFRAVCVGSGIKTTYGNVSPGFYLTHEYPLPIILYHDNFSGNATIGLAKG